MTYNRAVAVEEYEGDGGQEEGCEDPEVVRQLEVAKVVPAPPHQHVEDEEGAGDHPAGDEVGQQTKPCQLLVQRLTENYQY